MSDQAPKQGSLRIALTTVPRAYDSSALATHVIAEDLAACVQEDSTSRSWYKWQGQIQCDEEKRLWFKTTVTQLPLLFDAVGDLHPYETPQWIVLEAEGSDAYVDWVTHSCSKDPARNK